MRKDFLLVGIIVAALAMMVLPLDPRMIDVLLAINISLAVLLLMVAVYLKHPSDFSTFPSVILIGTAFRLSLSIATTRLILSEAEAGDIIETFGEFVVSGSIVIGLVIFLIITVVQFIVVTKGAERVAEVGARFALDALPGKQMSIDAEARAGSITDDEAAVKRRRLDRDSRFFGAMDGAMKFVKGDAIAGIIIIIINLLGGVGVGMSMHGYSFTEAIGIFSLLTVGDGLVAQLPALLMSLCAGIIVTRAESQIVADGQDLGSDISAEMIADPRVPAIGAPIVLAIGFIPGFPTFVFAGLAVTLFVISVVVRRALNKAKEVSTDAKSEPEAVEAPESEYPTDNRIRLQIGSSFAEELDLGDIAEQVASHLSELYLARGIRFPRPVVEVQDFGETREFALEIDEVPVDREVVPSDRLVLIEADPAKVQSAFSKQDLITWNNINAVWLPESFRAASQKFDFAIGTSEDAIARWAFRVYENNLGALFSNEVFNTLLAEARAAEPKLMESIEETLSEGALFKMFRYLIEDGVPVRPIKLVVSSIRYWLVTLEDPSPITLAECLRGSMKRQLCHRIAGKDRVLGLAVLAPEMDMEIRRALADKSRSALDEALEGLTMPPDTNERLLKPIRKLVDQQAHSGRQIALVAAAELRRKLRNHLASHSIHLPVLAPHEISNDISTVPIDLVAERREALNTTGRRKKDLGSEGKLMAAE